VDAPGGQRIHWPLAGSGAGIDVNACDEHGQTAFSYACAYNSCAAAKLLWEHGADINARHNGKWTPLDSAQTLGSAQFRAWLLSIGCQYGMLGPESPTAAPAELSPEAHRPHD
jgi:hypothetical protein